MGKKKFLGQRKHNVQRFKVQKNLAKLRNWRWPVWQKERDWGVVSQSPDPTVLKAMVKGLINKQLVETQKLLLCLLAVNIFLKKILHLFNSLSFFFMGHLIWKALRNLQSYNLILFEWKQKCNVSFVGFHDSNLGWIHPWVVSESIQLPLFLVLELSALNLFFEN